MVQTAGAGYVVMSTDGKRFLSRSLKWVRHRDRRIRGVTIHGSKRAWVHPTKFVQAGGDWFAGAGEALPALWDSVTNFTVVTGQAIPIGDVVLATP